MQQMKSGSNTSSTSVQRDLTMRPHASNHGYPGAAEMGSTGLGERHAFRVAPLGKLAAGLVLLVVDDDPPVLKACAEVARAMGFTVHTAGSAEEARMHVSTHAPDVVLMDLKMPAGGLTLLEEIRSSRPRSAVVIMTAYATIASAVEAMRIGATDYVTKPFAMDELVGVLDRAAQIRSNEIEVNRLPARLKKQEGSAMLGSSPEVEKLLRIVQKVGTANHPVLIQGEAGSGKETLARAIHAAGPNAERRFTLLECAQLSPEVLEAQLFGPAPGTEAAETGVRTGALTSEEGGTLFLDGISDVPLELQGRLLRALQDKQVRIARDEPALPVTVRLLAGSTRNLAALVEQGGFRKDLYYRLNVVSLRVPPLRERREDIPLLAEFFLQRLRRESAVPHRLSADALQALVEYSWPGNVRELETAIERACALSSGPMLHVNDLPAQMHGSPAPLPVVTRVDERRTETAAAPESPLGRRAIVSIAELEKEAILHTIRQLHGDKLMAAKLLGIGKTTLYRKLKGYGISDI